MTATIPQRLTQEKADQSYVHGLRYLILAAVVSVFRSLARHILNHSSKTAVEKISSLLEHALGTLRYYVDGPSVIQQYYETDKPYSVNTPGHKTVFVSSTAHVRELSDAPETHLSLHSVAREMFHPEHTMYNFVVHDDSKANGSIHSRVLRTLLTNNLTYLIPSLHGIADSTLRNEVDGGLSHSDGTRAVPTFCMARRLVCRVNSRVFFGESFSNNLEYLEAAAQYPQDVFISGEALQVAPTSMAPLINTLVTRNQKALKTMLKHLQPLVEERLAIARHQPDSPEKPPLDCIQWIIDSIPKKECWDTTKVLRELLALWFGSIHQLAMSFVYAIYDLCEHSEYLEPLRKELGRHGDQWPRYVNNLPLLDSFLKESARLNPSDSVSIRRKSLKQYTFANGTTIDTGDWVCVPQRAIMNDANHYTSPSTFDGFRFVLGETKSGNLTDVDTTFPLWGMGRRVCPGRFYAASTLKLMVGLVLEKYDVELTKPNKPRTFSWRSAIIPRPGTMTSFRIRDAQTN